VLWLSALTGCGAGSYASVKRADEPAGYYQFISNQPDSNHVAEARERIAYHEVRQSPSISRFEQFRTRYPESELLDALRPLVEAEAFEIARFEGSAEAYLAFAEEFPDGPYTRRAIGNAEYQRADGYAGQVDELERFAARHPESDFAAEALRTVESVRSKESRRYGRVILSLDFETLQPQRRQLLDEFVRRAMTQYEEYGVELSLAADSGSAMPEPPESRPSDAERTGSLWLTIRHREQVEDSRFEDATIVRPRTRVAETVVTLGSGADRAPIWERTFGFQQPAKDLSPDASMLLTPVADAFWKEWFVPVASWELDSATRSALALPGVAVAMDAARDRIAVLFDDGRVQVIELADPSNPLSLGEYRPDPAGVGAVRGRWSGLRIHEDRLLLFGRGGLASLKFGSDGPLLTVERTREQIGAITAVEPLGDDLLMASERGLLLWRDRGKQPLQVIARPIHGLALVGDTLLFTDQTTLFVTTLEHLRKQRVLARLPLGERFASGGSDRTGTLRSFGSTVAILGRSGTLLIDLKEPRKPRILGQLDAAQTGEVEDVARVGGNVFLLGERGLQQLNRSASHVAESIEVLPRRRLDRMGRYLVSVGDGWLQVVDATPFVAVHKAVTPVASWDAASEPESESGDARR